MKAARRNSTAELSLQRVEQLLRELNMTIECDGQLRITFDKKARIMRYYDYTLADTESGHGTPNLPREIETERLIIEDG